MGSGAAGIVRNYLHTSIQTHLQVSSYIHTGIIPRYPHTNCVVDTLFFELNLSLRMFQCCLDQTWSDLMVRRFFSAMDRDRSRSPTRVLTAAVMQELHRLPQSQRILLQQLRQQINVHNSLASINEMLTHMQKLGERSMWAPTPNHEEHIVEVQVQVTLILNDIPELREQIREDCKHIGRCSRPNYVATARTFKT